MVSVGHGGGFRAGRLRAREEYVFVADSGGRLGRRVFLNLVAGLVFVGAALGGIHRARVRFLFKRPLHRSLRFRAYIRWPFATTAARAATVGARLCFDIGGFYVRRWSAFP